MKCEEGELWYDSEYEEFAQMLDMNCFKLITKSEMKKLGLRQIGVGYVYRCKNDSAGNLTRRKSRYVCRGYEQRERASILQNLMPPLSATPPFVF